jgi:hypothetical protein
LVALGAIHTSTRYSRKFIAGEAFSEEENLDYFALFINRYYPVRAPVPIARGPECDRPAAVRNRRVRPATQVVIGAISAA